MKRLKFIAFISILLCLLIVIPSSFAVDNETVMTATNASDVLEADYYFDANIDNDNGTGTINNPYKELTPSRIVRNSVLHLASGEYDFTGSKSVNNVQIIGENPATTIVKGAKFTVSNSLTIYNVTFVSSTITNNGNFNAVNSIFKDSSSTLYGGVINSNNLVNLDNCTFINNSAKFGGAIYCKDGYLNIMNSRFINNSATLFGGAIISLNSRTVLDNSTFRDNKANYYGGAIYSLYGSFNLTKSKFNNNYASEGGALLIDDTDPCIISFNEFISNKAGSVGAIYSIANNIEDSLLDNNYFLNNTAGVENDVLQTATPNMTISNGDYILIYYNPTNTGDLPSKYDLRLLNQTTPVKNQGGGGNCWAFASLAALESCILKATGIAYDLSEENMKNLMAAYSDYGWDMAPNDGGYGKMAVGYLVSWLGPVNESDDAYSGSSFLSPVLNSFYHIQNCVYLVRNDYTDNDAIKRAIMEYGAVSTSIYWDSSYRLGPNSYYTGNKAQNHAVAIVGWDDNYSKNNFKSTPPGDGAWIIKNSWGTSSGDNGYFYVSYYDTKCAQIGRRDVSCTFILNDTIKYDKNYQYDIPGKTDFFFNTTSTVWFKNIFTSTEDEYLAAVSTYFEKVSNYTFYIYVNNDLKLTQSGISDMGYFTLNLNQLVPLNAGDIFEVVFKISVDGDAAFPISEDVSLNKMFYSNNISFLSYDGETWTDLFNLTWQYPDHSYYSQVACIKAFTVYDVISTTTNLTVDIEDGVNVKAHVLNQYNRPVTGGTVTFNVNGANYVVDVVNGFAILDLFKNIGEYHVSAIYNNSGYISSSDSTSFNISLINTTLSLDINLHNPLNITAYVINEYGYGVNCGNVTFTVDGVKYTVDVVDGVAYLDYLFETSKTYAVSAVFNPINYFVSSEVHESVDIPLIGTNITLTLSSQYNPVNITAKVLNRYGYAVNMGKVIFTVDGMSYTVDVSNGYATLTQIFKTFGKHDVAVAFNPINYYAPSYAQKEFDVNLIGTSLSITVEGEYNPADIHVDVVDEFGKAVNYGYVTIKVDNKEYRVNVVNGGADLKYNFKNNGLNEIYVEYYGSYYYNSSNSTSNIIINSTIISNDATKTFNSKYEFRLLDHYGNPLNKTNVSVTVGFKIYYLTTDENGVAILNIALNPAKYSIKITNPITKEVKTQTINVVKRIAENQDLTAYYGAGKYYKVKVVDDNGNVAKSVEVIFKINGESYTRTTDSNGYASFKISLKPGEYTITAEYKGFKVSNKITVKSTLVTKNINVKKGKTIKFTAKLLDKNGKILKNKKVTFKFKGKTYKIKTNSKGIATLKITKKYKVGKHTITTIYKELKIKNSIKIR